MNSDHCFSFEDCKDNFKRKERLKKKAIISIMTL